MRHVDVKVRRKKNIGNVFRPLKRPVPSSSSASPSSRTRLISRVATILYICAFVCSCLRSFVGFLLFFVLSELLCRAEILVSGENYSEVYSGDLSARSRTKRSKGCESPSARKLETSESSLLTFGARARPSCRYAIDCAVQCYAVLCCAVRCTASFERARTQKGNVANVCAIVAINTNRVCRPDSGVLRAFVFSVVNLASFGEYSAEGVSESFRGMPSGGSGKILLRQTAKKNVATRNNAAVPNRVETRNRVEKEES